MAKQAEEQEIEEKQEAKEVPFKGNQSPTAGSGPRSVFRSSWSAMKSPQNFGD